MPPITLLDPEKSKRSMGGDYSQRYSADLSDRVGTAMFNLRLMQEQGRSSEPDFIQQVSNAYHAMKRFVEAEHVQGFNFPEVIEMEKAPYRWAMPQLEQLEYPRDIDLAIKIIEDMLKCCPSRTPR